MRVSSKIRGGSLIRQRSGEELIFSTCLLVRQKLSGIKMTDIEEIKSERDGFDSLQDIKRSSVEGFDSIKEEDFERFKWYGVIHESRTGKYFMLRIRVPGGQLNSRQLGTIGELSKRYARGFADITTRQNIQLHWLKIEEIPKMIDELSAVGLTTKGTSGDTIANIITCPVAGFDRYEMYDTSNLVSDMSRHLLKNKDFSNLPRKFKIAISGCRLDCAKTEVNDVGFVAVKRKIGREEEVGFDLTIGGGLSLVPRFARSLGVFIKPEDVIEACAAVLEIFRDHGNRSRRNRARLKFLIDDWGEDKIRSALESKIKREFIRIETDYVRGEFTDHVGTFEQKQAGYYYNGISIPCGRITAEQMVGLAKLADEYGDGLMRTTAMQNIVILNVLKENLSKLDDGIDKLGLSKKPSPVERGLVCCIGEEFCKYGLVGTKRWGSDIVKTLGQNLILENSENIGIHVTGCPHGCAGNLIADIGLEGCLCKVDGEDAEAFNIRLGGRLGKGAMFGRMIERRVPINVAKIKIERLLGIYSKNRDKGESFKDFCARHTEQELAKYMA